MALIIDLKPEKEAVFVAHAQTRGLSIEEWLIGLAEQAVEGPPPHRQKFTNLSDLLLNSPFAGANLNLDRCPDFPRSTELE